MSLTLFEWWDYMDVFNGHPDFLEINEQLEAEYLFKGINFGHVEWILYRPENR